MYSCQQMLHRNVILLTVKLRWSTSFRLIIRVQFKSSQYLYGEQLGNTEYCQAKTGYKTGYHEASTFTLWKFTCDGNYNRKACCFEVCSPILPWTKGGRGNVILVDTTWFVWEETLFLFCLFFFLRQFKLRLSAYAFEKINEVKHWLQQRPNLCPSLKVYIRPLVHREHD